MTRPGIELRSINNDNNNNNRYEKLTYSGNDYDDNTDKL